MANDEQKNQTGNQTGTKPQGQKPTSQPQVPACDESIYNNNKDIIGQIKKGSINEGQVARPNKDNK